MLYRRGVSVDPFRERRFAPAEVRRVLRVAADLAERDPETTKVERALTRGELEQAASDLGLPATAIARALRGDDTKGSAGGDDDASRRSSQLIGAPTRIVLEAEVDGEPTEDEREDLIEDIRAFVGEAGAIESVGKTLAWRQTSTYQRNGRELSVRLRSRDGRTKIVVEERLVRQATGLFVGLGVGGGIGPMGIYILSILKLGALGAIVPALWIPFMLLLARTIFVSLAARRQRAASALLKKVTGAAAGWVSASAPKRVRVPAAKKRASVDVDDDDAAAEDDAAATDEADVTTRGRSKAR